MQVPLVGTWRLISTEQRLTNGTIQPSPIYGPNGSGYLTYSLTGRMSVILVNPDRPLWKSEDNPTPEEIKSAMDGFIAYYGSYEVNETEGFIIHHIEAHLVPNWTGDQKRYFVLLGDRLTLRVVPPLSDGLVEYKLVWERA
jgi:hypothetical protein